MGTALAIVLYALLGLLATLVFLPFRLQAAGAVHDGEPLGAARVDWGLGLLAVQLDTSRRVTVQIAWVPLRFLMGARKAREEKPRKPRRPKPKPKRKEKEKEKASGLRRLRGLLADRAAFRRMAGRLVRALHLRLSAEGRVGLGDPADTAVLFSLLNAAARLPGVTLAVELDWVEEELELEAVASARVWIAELLAVAAVLLLERANRRALRVALGRA